MLNMDGDWFQFFNDYHQNAKKRKGDLFRDHPLDCFDEGGATVPFTKLNSMNSVASGQVLMWYFRVL
jgi:hypothetical protein